MLVCKDSIELLIPQRAPFVMIDNLCEATSNKFITDLLVLPMNIFLDEGILSPYGLIEHLVQSGAAGLSYLNMTTQGAPKDGFIGSISKLVVHKLPKLNEQICTVVTKLHQLHNLYLLRGVSSVHEDVLLECEFKLVRGSSDTGIKY